MLDCEPRETIRVYAPVNQPCPYEGDEVLHAYQLESGMAEIFDIPLRAIGYSRGDVVRLDDDNRIVEVVERKARTRRGTYSTEGTPEEVQARWMAIHCFLREWCIDSHPDPRWASRLVEDAIDPDASELIQLYQWPGVFSMAVPFDLTDRDLVRLNSATPVPWNLVVE